MASKLTDRQRTILDFVTRYIGSNGYPPSIREIGAGLKINSLRGVTVHLDALERKGFIRRESTSRSIQVLKAVETIGADYFASVPLIGTIAAGQPLPAAENIEGYISLPKSMLGSARDAFLLRVRGDSMVDAHIVDGDLVLIRPQQTAENGDLVAALLDDEATVKRFQMNGEEAILMPANQAYQPIPMRRPGARLIGKVIGLLRAY